MEFRIEESLHIEIWWREYRILQLTYTLMEEYGSMFVLDLKTEMERKIRNSFIEVVPPKYHPRYMIDITKAAMKVTEWLEQKAKETVQIKRLSNHIVNEPKQPAHIKVGMNLEDAQDVLAGDIPQWLRDSLTKQINAAYTPQHIKKYCTFCMAEYNVYKCRGHK